MRDILTDIRGRLRQGEYQNEEHVRLALVCRLLSKVGWNIWDPNEVNTEFPPIPTEDRTRVDIALFADEFSPSIFIEVKAVGKIGRSLPEIERQVRDYNRNNTALFSIITDGRIWRFYYSQTGGEFHHKCFKKCDLIDDDLEDLEQTFFLFFGEENILNERAEDQAQKYLQLTKMQKAVQDCLAQAKRMVQSPPYPTLPQAVVDLLEQKDFRLSEEKVSDLLNRMPEQATPSTSNSDNGADPKRVAPNVMPGGNNEIITLNADNPGDLRFTKVQGTIDGESGRNWKDLTNIGIRLAVQSGEDVHSLNAYLPRNFREGFHTEKGFYPMEDLDLSIRAMDAKTAAKTLILLAKKLDCRLELNLLWGQEAPYAGKQGVLRWPSLL